MDLAVNKTTAWSVELESTFTSRAEPGEGKYKITRVHKIIELLFRYFLVSEYIPPSQIPSLSPALPRFKIANLV